MRQLIVVLLASMLFACSDEGSEEAGGVAGKDERLYGKWAFADPNTKCVEEWMFESNGRVTITANEEKITGMYFTDFVENNTVRSSLNFSVTTDNGMPDCEGVSDDDIGFTATIYYETYDDTLALFGDVSSTDELLRLGRE